MLFSPPNLAETPYHVPGYGPVLNFISPSNITIYRILMSSKLKQVVVVFGYIDSEKKICYLQAFYPRTYQGSSHERIDITQSTVHIATPQRSRNAVGH